MSSNLEWFPLDMKGKGLPDALKFALRKRFEEPVDMVMDETYVSYLHGLIDAGVDGASSLLEAIEKHGAVRVQEVY